MAAKPREGVAEHGPDDARFLNVAEGSRAETEYRLIRRADLAYGPKPAAETLVKETGEIARMLYALRSRVETGAKA